MTLQQSSLAHSASTSPCCLCQGPNRLLYSLSHCVQTAMLQVIQRSSRGGCNQGLQDARTGYCSIMCQSASEGVTHSHSHFCQFLVFQQGCLLNIKCCKCCNVAQLWAYNDRAHHLSTTVYPLCTHDIDASHCNCIKQSHRVRSVKMESARVRLWFQ